RGQPSSAEIGMDAGFEGGRVTADHARLVALAVTLADRAVLHARDQPLAGLAERSLRGWHERTAPDLSDRVAAPRLRGGQCTRAAERSADLLLLALEGSSSGGGVKRLVAR